MRSKKKHIPQLRFPAFKKEWSYIPLSKLLKESKERNEKLIFTRENVLSVSRELGIVNQIIHLGRSYAGKSVHNYHIVKPGFIVYTKSPLKNNPYGILKFNSGQAGIVSTLYAVYIPNKDQINSAFLDYYFSLESRTNNYLRPLVKKGAKNDMKVNNARVLENKVYIPDINEQNHIANFLKAIEMRLNLMKEKEQSLQLYKQGVLQKIFQRKIKFVDSRNKPFPRWKEMKARDVFYNHTNKKHDGRLPILAVTQDRGVVPRSSIEKEIKSSENSIRSYKIVEKGDFVISLRSFEGGIEYSEYEGICSPAYTVLKPRIKIDNQFFRYYFKKDDFINRLSQTVVGIRDGKQISYDAFGSLMLNIPSNEEQIHISQLLSTLEKKLHLVKESIVQTELYKRSLLQKMFV